MTRGPARRTLTSVSRRPPPWACDSYATHGGSAVCPKCLRNYEASGEAERREEWFPPRVEFRRGWLSIGATHLFAATPATVFPAKDGVRVLAQTACGGIVDVTRTYAPRRSDLCSKCLGVIKRATLGGKVNGPHAEVALDAAVHGISPPTTAVLRLYRGLKGAYDPTRVARDGFAGVDFTDCPYQALRFAAGSRGVVLVLDVPENLRRLHEAYWFGPNARRFQIHGLFEEFLIACIPAKDLRTHLRGKGMRTLCTEDKSYMLACHIEDHLSAVNRTPSEYPTIG